LGFYTALLAGLNNGTGIGLVEVYDHGAPERLENSKSEARNPNQTRITQG
jgi:hypothetical protein